MVATITRLLPDLWFQPALCEWKVFQNYKNLRTFGAMHCSKKLVDNLVETMWFFTHWSTTVQNNCLHILRLWCHLFLFWQVASQIIYYLRKVFMEQLFSKGPNFLACICNYSGLLHNNFHIFLEVTGSKPWIRIILSRSDRDQHIKGIIVWNFKSGSTTAFSIDYC